MVVFKAYNDYGYKYKAVPKSTFDKYVSQSYNLKNEIVKTFKGPKSADDAYKFCDNFNASGEGDRFKTGPFYD